MRRILPLIALLAGPALALDDPQTPLVDPYASGMWDYHQVRLLGDPARIAFDDRVKVMAPAAAEDTTQVPVLIDATAIPDVERIVVTVDYSPIPHVLTFYPDRAAAKLSFRFKIDQATPVRASVRTRDGRWFVGGTQIDAAGGGCTAPAAAYASDDWEEHLGEVRARVWPASGRVRLIVDHPMDTGLVDGIPVFIVETLTLAGADGAPIARLELHEPVSEDPAFSLDVAPDLLAGPLVLTGRDNNGNPVRATLQPGPMQ